MKKILHAFVLLFGAALLCNVAGAQTNSQQLTTPPAVEIPKSQDAPKSRPASKRKSAPKKSTSAQIPEYQLTAPPDDQMKRANRASTPQPAPPPDGGKMMLRETNTHKRSSKSKSTDRNPDDSRFQLTAPPSGNNLAK